MVYIPVNWEDTGRLPQQGVPQTDGSETVEGTVWDVGVAPNGRGDGGGVPAGGGNLSRPSP